MSPQQFQILLALSALTVTATASSSRSPADRRRDARLTGTLYTALAGLEAASSSKRRVAGGAARRRSASGVGEPDACQASDSRRRYYRLTPIGRAVLEAEPRASVARQRARQRCDADRPSGARRTITITDK
jgi:hypothetical protein